MDIARTTSCWCALRARDDGLMIAANDLAVPDLARRRRQTGRPHDQRQAMHARP